MTGTSDNAGRFTAREFRSAIQAATEAASEGCTYAYDAVAFEALRIAARVSAEPDEETLKAYVRAGCTRQAKNLRCQFPNCGCQMLPREASAAIAAYRDRVLRGE